MPRLQEPADLVVTGARLLGEQVESSEPVDVVVHQGHVLSIVPAGTAPTALRTLLASGMYVSRGLVDAHVHAYPGVTPWGIDAAPPSLACGVTTVVDAGSAGVSTLAGLRQAMAAQRIEARCLLNVSSIGLAAEFGELLHAGLIDTEATRAAVRANRDLVVGLKVRVAPNTTGPNWRTALRSAREAADDLGVPIMVHVSEGPPDLGSIAEYLRAGDIVTHCFTPYGNGLVSKDLTVNPWSEELIAAGVRFDVGHGRGSFSFPHAEVALDHGLLPELVSTDLHADCVNGPAFGMTTVMNKLLVAGMPAGALWQACTSAPARVAGVHEALEPGSPADLAVFVQERGDFEYWDSRGVTRRSPSRWRCTATLRSGRPAYVAPSIRTIVLQGG